MLTLVCWVGLASLPGAQTGAQPAAPRIPDRPSESPQVHPQHPPSGADPQHKAPPLSDEKVRTLPNLSKRQGWPNPVADNETYSFLQFDPFEYRRDRDADVLRWDILGWRGGDRQRFWFKSEGNQAFTRNKVNQADLQFLYGRLISPFYDFQIGLRYDQRWGAAPYRGRAFLVIGLQGLAPGRFEVEPVLFISQEGNVSARFTASYNSQITQRLILQPRFEINAAFSELKALGYASGLNEVEFGLRLRYELRREFAPYIGFSWSYTRGSSDAFGRRIDEEGWQFSLIAGVRAWF